MAVPYDGVVPSADAFRDHFRTQLAAELDSVYAGGVASSSSAAWANLVDLQVAVEDVVVVEALQVLLAVPHLAEYAAAAVVEVKPPFRPVVYGYWADFEALPNSAADTTDTENEAVVAAAAAANCLASDGYSTSNTDHRRAAGCLRAEVAVRKHHLLEAHTLPGTVV